MLWINMVMDTLAGLAFAFEPPLIEYMKEYNCDILESIDIFKEHNKNKIKCLLMLDKPYFCISWQYRQKYF